jgi:hypothetical protein
LQGSSTKPTQRSATAALAGWTIGLVGLVGLVSCGASVSPEAREALSRLNTHIGSATYYVTGWVAPQKSGSLSLGRHARLVFEFQQCARGLEPRECDRRHAWKHVEQRLLLLQMKSRSVQVVEVSGAPLAGGPDTSHALIYRCLQNRPCTEGDLGTLSTVAIPCPDLARCEQAAADLEKIIALAQAK